MQNNADFVQKLKHHSISIISLLVAITALTYNTWRANTSEDNRNIRFATFEMIKQLGELQNITNQVHFIIKLEQDDLRQQQLINGWGHIALIEDLAALLPAPIEGAASQLKIDWQKHHKNLGGQQVTSRTSPTAEQAISKSIANLREQSRVLIKKLQ